MDLTGTLILAAIGVVIGFLTGALIFSLRRGESTPPPPTKRRTSKQQQELHFWREGANNRLVVEMDGVTYRRGNDLSTEQKRRLAILRNDLHSWLELPPIASVPAKPDVASPEAAPSVDEEKRVSLNPFSIFTRSFQPVEKTGSDEPDKSIVEQIDEILQTKLQGTRLETRGIRLVEAPDQGMVIEVGLERYREIDSVPDETIRQILRVSVAEWENRSVK